MLARRIGLDLADVSDAVRRPGSRGKAAGNPAAAPPDQVATITLASLPRTAAIALERDALMGILQFGHRLDGDVVRRALADEFSHPALDAIRRALLAVEDLQRMGWSVAAVETVREPFRSLAAELLTGDYPARTEAAAVASAAGTTRTLTVRSLDRQKSELLRTIQRVSPESEEGRAIRIRLRELDAQRQRLVSD